MIVWNEVKTKDATTEVLAPYHVGINVPTGRGCCDRRPQAGESDAACRCIDWTSTPLQPRACWASVHWRSRRGMTTRRATTPASLALKTALCALGLALASIVQVTISFEKSIRSFYGGKMPSDDSWG